MIASSWLCSRRGPATTTSARPRSRSGPSERRGYWKPYDYISSRPFAPDTRPLSPLGRLLISGIELKKLGTVTTNDGKKYCGARLVAADPAGVIILTDDGFYRILNSDLDPVMRQRVMASTRPPSARTDDSLAGL